MATAAADDVPWDVRYNEGGGGGGAAANTFPLPRWGGVIGGVPVYDGPFDARRYTPQSRGDDPAWTEYLHSVSRAVDAAYATAAPPPWAALDVMCIHAQLHTLRGRVEFMRRVHEAYNRATDVALAYTAKRFHDDEPDDGLEWSLRGSTDVGAAVTAAPFSQRVPLAVLLRALVPADPLGAPADDTWAVPERDAASGAAKRCAFMRAARGAAWITESHAMPCDPDAPGSALRALMATFTNQRAAAREQLNWIAAGFAASSAEPNGIGAGDGRVPIHRLVVPIVMLAFRDCVAHHVCEYTTLTDATGAVVATMTAPLHGARVRYGIAKALMIYRVFHDAVREAFRTATTAVGGGGGDVALRDATLRGIANRVRILTRPAHPDPASRASSYAAVVAAASVAAVASVTQRPSERPRGAAPPPQAASTRKAAPPPLPEPKPTPPPPKPVGTVTQIVRGQRVPVSTSTAAAAAKPPTRPTLSDEERGQLLARLNAEGQGALLVQENADEQMLRDHVRPSEILAAVGTALTGCLHPLAGAMGDALDDDQAIPDDVLSKWLVLVRAFWDTQNLSAGDRNFQHRVDAAAVELAQRPNGPGTVTLAVDFTGAVGEDVLRQAAVDLMGVLLADSTRPSEPGSMSQLQKQLTVIAATRFNVRVLMERTSMYTPYIFTTAVPGMVASDSDEYEPAFIERQRLGVGPVSKGRGIVAMLTPGVAHLATGGLFPDTLVRPRVITDAIGVPPDDGPHRTVRDLLDRPFKSAIPPPESPFEAKYDGASDAESPTAMASPLPSRGGGTGTEPTSTPKRGGRARRGGRRKRGARK